MIPENVQKGAGKTRSIPTDIVVSTDGISCITYNRGLSIADTNRAGIFLMYFGNSYLNSRFSFYLISSFI